MNVMEQEMNQQARIRDWKALGGVGWVTRGGLRVTLEGRRFRVAGHGKIRSFETVRNVLRFVGEPPVRLWTGDRPRAWGHARRVELDRVEEA